MGSDNKGFHHDNSVHPSNDPSNPKGIENNRDVLQKTMGYRQGFALMLGLILGRNSYSIHDSDWLNKYNSCQSFIIHKIRRG